MRRIISLPAKPIVTFYQPDDPRKVCAFATDNKIFGKLQVRTTHYEGGTNFFITELRNRFGKFFGSENFIMRKDSSVLEGKLIKVEEEYQHRGYDFGETLRLSSIIQMIENNATKFKIESKNDAVYFHTKFKFTPAMTKDKECEKFLASVLENPSEGFESFHEAARELQKIEFAISQEEFANRCNALAKKYLREVMKEKDAYKSHPMKSMMDMELTMDSILENREFFNALFQKHKIDYTIM